MSDNAKVLKDHLGTPLAWLKNSKGEVVLDTSGVALTRFIKSFTYSYDEENDDEAVLKFEFPGPTHCNNAMFEKSTVWKVQWGYNTNEDGVIKSPERLIALRDKKVKYTSSGIEMTLECTDLISYTKNIKTNTVKKTSYFVDWLREISEGKFKATVTTHGFKTIIEKDGTMEDFEFDEKTNAVKQKAVDNARFETRTRKLNFSKVIKGKSLSINNAIKDLLPDISEGPYILDTTDDKMEIKTRNFNQNIYKTFTFRGVHGELIEFESKSDTRKVKEDGKYTTKVDPRTKQVEDRQIDTGDTSIGSVIARNTNSTAHKPNQEEIDHWIRNANLIYEHNVKHPLDQLEVPPLSYRRTVASTDNYMGQTVLVEKPITYSLQAKEILNDPELEDQISSNRLTNHAIERIQTKYEAKAKIIGDPSLIKGKVYYFSNLAKEDIGKWYSTKVVHKIDSGAYYTEMELVKKPGTIVIVDNSNIKTMEYDNEADQLEYKEEQTNDNSEVYKQEEKTTLDDNDTQDIAREPETESSEAKAIQGRVDQLSAEDDFSPNNNESNNYNLSEDDFKTNTSGIPSFNESNFEELNKPNNERF